MWSPPPIVTFWMTMLVTNTARRLDRYRSRWQVTNFPGRAGAPRRTHEPSLIWLTGRAFPRSLLWLLGRSYPRSLIWLPGWPYSRSFIRFGRSQCTTFTYSYETKHEGRSSDDLYTILFTKQQYVLLCSHWIRNGNQTSSVFNNWLVSWCNINVLTSTGYTWTLYHTLVQINGICVHLSVEGFVLTPYINGMSTFAGVYL